MPKEIIYLETLAEMDSVAASHGINLDSVLNSTNVTFSNQKVVEQTDWTTIILFSIGLLILLGSFAYLFFGPSRSWIRGKFPRSLRYSSKNLFEAYICLGIEMIRRDKSQNLKTQFKHLAHYLRTKFPDFKYDHYQHIMQTVPLKIKIETVVAWLKKKMPEQEHIQIIDYLSDLAFSNNEVTSLEIDFIRYMARELKIVDSEFNSVFNLRLQRHQREKWEREQANQSQHSSKTTYTPKSILEEAFSALGITADSSWEIVKSNYRKLAKKFHPDLFVRMGKGEQQMANERFTAINEAYGVLTKHFQK